MACVTISNDRERCQDPYHSNPFSWPDGERGRSRHDSYPIRESGEEKANNARPPELNIIPMGPLWGGPDPDGAPSRRSGHECVPEPLDPARRPIADVLGFVFPDGVRSRRWVRLSRGIQSRRWVRFPRRHRKPSLGSSFPRGSTGGDVGFVFPGGAARGGSAWTRGGLGSSFRAGPRCDRVATRPPVLGSFCPGGSPRCRSGPAAGVRDRPGFPGGPFPKGPGSRKIDPVGPVDGRPDPRAPGGGGWLP